MTGTASKVDGCYSVDQKYEGVVAMRYEDNGGAQSDGGYRFLKSWEDKVDARYGKAIYTIDDIMYGAKHTRFMIVIDFYSPDGEKMNGHRRFVKIWTKANLSRVLRMRSMTLIGVKQKTANAT